MTVDITTDITVIGGGPGGYAAAITAARLKAEVTLIEKDKLGGTCLNVGCIPTKALLKCAEVYSSIHKASAYGIESSQTRLDFAKAMQFKEQVVTRLVGGVSHLVKANKINLIKGEAKLIDPHTISVKTVQGEVSVKSKHIILATGATEITIPGFEPDGEHILNSTQMLSIKELPKKLAIIGGGVIGVEFASLFSRLGVEVTIVELTPRLIPLEDEELSNALKQVLEANKIKILLNTSAQNYNIQGETLNLQVKGPEGAINTITCDKILVCVGRKANIQDVGVNELEIPINKGRIITDSRMKTKVDSIYAIGDLTCSEQLAHVAYQEARTAVLNIMGSPCKADYTAIPHCIYSSPEIASVGLTETAAREKYINIGVARFPFYGNGKALIEGYTEGFVKLIFTAEEQLIGASIIGPKATELIAELTLAVGKQMNIKDIANTVHAHPTLSEAVQEAGLSAMGLNLHSM